MAGPPVVLIHGFGGTAATTWGQNGWIDLLTEAGRQVIAIDLLGHGEAEKPHDPDAYGELEAAALAQFPEEPVDAIGFSLGARTLLWLASTEPARFNRLVVSGVGAQLFEESAEHRKTIRDAVFGTPEPANPIATYFADITNDPNSDAEALRALMSSPRPTLTQEMLSSVSAPTLVVLGDQDFAGPAEPLVEALGDVSLQMLRGVDHFGTPKQFGFIEATLDFLDAQPF